jgi:hypothetical protein
MKTILFIILCCLIFLSISCSSLKEKDFQGRWVINKIYSDTGVVMDFSNQIAVNNTIETIKGQLITTMLPSGKSEKDSLEIINTFNKYAKSFSETEINFDKDKCVLISKKINLFQNSEHIDTTTYSFNQKEYVLIERNDQKGENLKVSITDNILYLTNLKESRQKIPVKINFRRPD